MTVEPQGRPSTPSLFADALSQMTTLFETEIRLVRTELSEKISLAINAVIILLVAAVLLIVGLFIILFGIVELVIFFGVVAWLAYFIVGGVFALIGVIALVVALKRLSADKLIPKRAIDQLGKDAVVVKEQVQ